MRYPLKYSRRKIQKNIVKKRLFDYLFLISFSLLPVYYSSSGGIQISHAVLALASIIFLLKEKSTFLTDSNIILFLFALYIFLHETFMEFFLPSESIIDGLMPIAYILFNLIIFTACCNWLSRKNSLTFFLKYGVIIAAILSFVGVLLFGFTLRGEKIGARAIGTFNNPNQLGYFSVCTSSISVLLFFKRAITYKELMFLVAACLFMAVASLSKATMVSISLPIFCFPWFFATLPRKKKITIFLIIVCVFSMLYVSNPIQIITDLNRYTFYHRLKNIGSQNDDSFSGRGYDLFFQGNASEMLFGYGPDRVNELVGNEVHSTLFSVITNYGIIGFSLFFTFIASWGVRVFKTYGFLGLFSVFFPPMLYGITHNGTRFTIFWILLSLSFSNLHTKYVPGNRNLYDPNRRRLKYLVRIKV